jgi:molecular chaperone GrpE
MSMNTDADSDPSEGKAADQIRPKSSDSSRSGDLQAEISAQRDRYLRLAADFENFRRRSAQEAERRAAAQKESFILELLPVIDNLERALGSHASTSVEQLRQGVEMTLQQLMQLLRRHGVEPKESVGQPFDTRYHEAVAVRHDPSRPDHIVLETFQRGYLRGDEVFRPAKVVVNDLSRVEPARDAD